MQEKHYTLLQLNKSIQKLITGIRNEYWISAEISQIQLAEHAYLELVQKENDRIVAKSKANIWSSQLRFLINRYGESDLQSLLRVGNKLLIKVLVTFHEVYGIALQVQDLDMRYTLGEMEERRLRTIAVLEQAGLLQAQAEKELPVVLQRIAVISSALAAGYDDFMNQLTQNTHGYAFAVRFFAAAVQGNDAALEIKDRLRQCAEGNYDAVVIIRGGGSRLDLEVFNERALAEAIATHPYPVLTGIGHQRDTTVTDLVAHKAFKTPTAVAEFIIQHNMDFENAVNAQQQLVFLYSREWLQHLENELLRLCTDFRHRGALVVHNANAQLRGIEEGLRLVLKYVLQQEEERLKTLEREFRVSDPEYILAKGFAIVTWEGKAISARASLPATNAVLEIHTSNLKMKASLLELVRRKPAKPTARPRTRNQKN